MAKRQNFVVGSTNPNTQSRTPTQLNNAWNQFEVLRSGVLDGVFNAVSDYSNDSSNEIANAIVELTGSQPTGATQTELAEALHKMREDIETTSLTFVGYISATQPSSSDYDFQVGNIWIQSATLPTSFPVAIAGIWDGTQWSSTTDTYTQKDFDFFRNINDGEGYYWFGGEWKVMSTDMSTTYFTLNQTSGKWEIKDSVNLPGAPTVATPTSASPQTQIANKKYVDENISAISSDFDLFDHKWRDATTNNTRWTLSDGNWVTDKPDAYQHLVDDRIPAYCWIDQTDYPNVVYKYTLSAQPEVGDAVYVLDGDGSFILSTQTVSEVAVDFSYIKTSGSLRQYEKAPLYQDTYLSTVETIAGTAIRYYQTKDGHKIVYADQETNADAIYAATGVAWYYIIDTANEQFKLPRTKFGFVGLRDTVGNYVSESAPNIKGKFSVTNAASGPKGNINATDGCVYADGTTSGGYTTFASDANSASGPKVAHIDASRSSSTYQDDAPVQQRATQMYLYFYVGA